MDGDKAIEGKEVRKVRELLGLTQEAFAKSLGVTKVTVVRWESGARACKGASAMKIYDLERNRRGTMLSRATTIFSVNMERFAHFDGGRAIRVFRDLLYCEVRRRGIPVTEVDISELEIADGGIDARVRGSGLSQSSMLQSGANYFQIKAGGSAAPWQKQWIASEVFTKDRQSKEMKLGEEIERCLKEGGRYVLVCFGKDLTPQQVSKAKEYLCASFSQYGYQNAKVEVWGQQQLKALVSPFPSLCLQIMGRDDLPFKSYASWKLESEMSAAFVMDMQREKLVQNLRESLLNNEVRHIRVSGEAGVGKTRLVLEALSVPALHPHVVYVSNVESFLNSSLFSKLCMEDAEYDVILVLDDCIAQKRVEVWNSLRNHTARCTLISIDLSVDASNDELECTLGCPTLSDEGILEILASYIGLNTDLRRWVELCSGSPRMAHLIGQNLRSKSEDVLLPPSTVLVLDRLIHGNRSGERDKATMFVVEHLALFERFGYEGSVQGEAKHIQKLIAIGDASITWPKFQSIVGELQSQGILKGKTTLHISPKALHIHLWTEFWRHGRDSLRMILDGLPETLLTWFARMFPYAGRSEVAIREFKQLFSMDGPFYKTDVLRPVACTILNELAEAFPEETLLCLERTTSEMNRKMLLNFKEGRGNVVFALEKIAWHSDLFYRAADILLRLAEAENSSYSNNSIGIFAALFHLYPGVAPTGASYSERLSVLEAALRSDSSHTRRVGLEGCAQALARPIHAKVRILGSEYQALKPTLSPWIPKTWEEYREAFKGAWSLLFTATRSWDCDDRRRANTLLIHKGQYLLKSKNYGWLHQDILRALSVLVDDDATDKKDFIDVLTTIQRFSGDISKDVLAALRQIEEQITGTDVVSRLKRWLHLGSHNDRSGAEEALWARRIEVLAHDILADEGLFQTVLPDLVKEPNITIWEFGQALSRGDQQRKCLPHILGSYRALQDIASVQFLSGYLKPIFDTAPFEWNQIISRLVDETAFAKVVGTLITKSGFNDFAVEQLLERYDQQRLNIVCFTCMKFTKALKGLRLENVLAIVQRFCDVDRIIDGLELLWYVFCSEKDQKKLPESLTLDLLKARGDLGNGGQYYWRVVAEQFISQFPQHQHTIVSVIFGRIAQEVDQFYYDQEVAQLVRNILKKDSRRSWTLFSAFLENQNDLESFGILHWFKMSLSMQLFPKEKVWAWISEAPEKRAPLISEIVDCDFTSEGCYARELLDRYGDNERVQHNLLANCFSGSWVGNASEYFKNKKDVALEWKKQTGSRRVKRWLDQYVGVLSQEVDKALIREERGF